MLGNAAFDLVGQMSIGPTDQTLDFPLRVAMMRVLTCIEGAAQSGAEASTNSFNSFADGMAPLHASAYRELTFQAKTKLNDEPIACGDNERAPLGSGKAKRRAMPRSLEIWSHFLRKTGSHFSGKCFRQ